MKEVERPRPLSARNRCLSAALVGLVGAVCRTLRLTVEGEEGAARAIAEHGGAIFVTWHGRTLLPAWRLRRRGWWVLVSLSRDGDIQAENFRRFGFRVIRGSTGRRGVAATREILAALADGGVLAFTPDGPRGPTRVVQEGVVYFAQRSGKPIIPGGVSAWPRWQLSTWDRYLIPCPFSRAHWVYGEPILVGPDEEVQAVCQRIGAAIDALERRAERAVHGT